MVHCSCFETAQFSFAPAVANEEVVWLGFFFKSVSCSQLRRHKKYCTLHWNQNSSSVFTTDAWEWTDTGQKPLNADVTNPLANYLKKWTIKIKLTDQRNKSGNKNSPWWVQPTGESCLGARGIFSLISYGARNWDPDRGNVFLKPYPVQHHCWCLGSALQHSFRHSLEQRN